MRGAWQATIVDDEGNVQPFASVEVRNQDGALVSLFDAETGGSAISNPFDADGEGFAQFYCDPQLVDIEATTASGIREWDGVAVGAGPSAVQNVTGSTTAMTPRLSSTTTVNVDAATATITLPASVPIGGRVHVRKINATQGTVSIERSGSDTITRAALESVSLNADGDNWLLEKVSSTRWEPVAGVESGENSDGEYWLYADGTLISTAIGFQPDWGINTYQSVPLPRELVRPGTAFVTLFSGGDALDILKDAVVDTTSTGLIRVVFRGDLDGSVDSTINVKAFGQWY